jgi:hypothetical protein
MFFELDNTALRLSTRVLEKKKKGKRLREALKRTKLPHLGYFILNILEKRNTGRVTSKLKLALQFFQQVVVLMSIMHDHIKSKQC